MGTNYDNKRYLVGTNAYVASGKDGYKTFGKLFNDPKYEGVDTYLLMRKVSLNL